MFTGIISTVTPITARKRLNSGLRLSLKTPGSWDDLELGESIALNGVCLTVAKIGGDEYDVVLVPETLAKTSFGQSVVKQVNIERALKASDRFGGHFVEGHVDTTGTVAGVDKSNGYRLEINFPAQYQQLIIDKGAITIDGVSLTIASQKPTSFSVALVPYTLKHTTLGSLKKGDNVNLEFDMIGKYIVNILEHKDHAAA